MAKIESTFTYEIGDIFVGQWEFSADVDVEDDPYTGPYVSSVTDIKLLERNAILLIELSDDRPILSGLCRAIQEHCEQDDEILAAALRAEADPRDTAADAKYREVREMA